MYVCYDFAGAEFSIFLLTFARAIQQRSANALFLIRYININPFTTDPVKALHFAILV